MGRSSRRPWRRPLWRWRSRGRLCGWWLSRGASLPRWRRSSSPVFPGCVLYRQKCWQTKYRPSILSWWYSHVCRAAAGIRPLSRSIHKTVCQQVRDSYSATKPHKLNCRAEPCDRSADFDRDKSSAKSRRLSYGAEPGFGSAQVSSGSSKPSVVRQEPRIRAA
jgi:hypothetical protein